MVADVFMPRAFTGFAAGGVGSLPGRQMILALRYRAFGFQAEVATALLLT